MWKPELYQRAICFAGEAHAQQLFPGTRANYVVHLAEVAMEILYAWQLAPGNWDVNLAMQCALLHDTLEDTEIGYDTLANRFGDTVAQGVLALSKNKHLPKSEQMMDSLLRIRGCGQAEIAMVKLADRITNLQSPPNHWSQAKIAAYADEAGVILDQLGGYSACLGQRLREKISEYQRFL